MADDTLVLIDVLLPARFDNYSELTHAAREPPGRRLDRTRLLGYSTTVSLGREHACAAHRLDLLLGQLGELLGLDNQRLLGQLALAKHLEDTLGKGGRGGGGSEGRGAGQRWKGGGVGAQPVTPRSPWLPPLPPWARCAASASGAHANAHGGGGGGGASEKSAARRLLRARPTVARTALQQARPRASPP